MTEHSESTLISKGSCDNCGSSDANALYSDGHSHCFSCGAYTHGEGSQGGTPATPKNKDLVHPGEFKPNHKRKLSLETVKKWGYTVGTYAGQVVQIATSRDDSGAPIGQKIRFPDKTFLQKGDYGKRFYGQHLWRTGGRKLVITEGELDALSVSQMQSHKWPVVSVPTGADGAAKVFRKNIEWLESFEEVILMFDQDDVGRAAAEECGLLLSPGKCKVAYLPLKDASDMLQADRGAEIVNAIWDAKPFRPDGIVNGNELWDLVSEPDAHPGLPSPWPFLDAKLDGLRRGEVTTWTAGSGVGKSALVTEIGYHLHSLGETVGWLKLEEPIKRSARGLLGIYLGLPHNRVREAPPDQLREAYDAVLGTGRMFLYDHFGSTAMENLLGRIRFLVVGCGCSHVVLDHISIVVSGMGEGDERRLIDNLMTSLATLATELNVALHIISHLTRPKGDKGHEEGAVTSLSQLRGSHAIAQLSHNVIGVERNQQGDNPNISTIRVLKCRETGETGIAGYLRYDRETGRMVEHTPEAEPAFEDETDAPF